MAPLEVSGTWCVGLAPTDYNKRSSQNNSVSIHNSLHTPRLLPYTMLLLRSSISLICFTLAAHAALQGFNYDAKNQSQNDFEGKFKLAKNLPGTEGRFTSARLYTMIQDNTIDDTISAVPAALKTNISLLLGLWASAGQAQFNNELTALRKAIERYDSQLQELVIGISVGSEDLYRSSSLGQQNNAGQGTEATVLVGYIEQVRGIIKNTVFEDIPVGHIDTWTAYVNRTNAELIDACDWLGMDAYPYFEQNVSNTIDDGQRVFQSAIDKTRQVAGGKPIWVTETGWPVKGPVFDRAVASVQNAEHYYKTVGCSLNSTNTWWFTLQESGSNPDFGILDADNHPFFDLSCGDVRLHLPTSLSQISTFTQNLSKVNSATEDSQVASTSVSQLYCTI